MPWDEATREEFVGSLRRFCDRRLPLDVTLAHDEGGRFPREVIDALYAELGLQLAFLPEEHGGLGGGALDMARICEVLAAADLGIATSLLATFLGLDPLVVGGTPRQKERWIGRAARGVVMGYAASEPEGGSDLTRMRTRAEPVRAGEADRARGDAACGDGYVLRGAKQWITNAGVAEAYTVLARAPDGPSWFVVEAGAPGMSVGKPEDKHGIRLSPTGVVTFDDVFVARDQLVGEREGLGLKQAAAVFALTRVMVAASALGAGWAALGRAIRYSRQRHVGGAPLAENQGYTHKLLVPNAVRLEAARAYVEHTARLVDAGNDALDAEGAISKYAASEAAKRAAGDAMQALGAYGYVREYGVEKICRDVRVTTIYEGTSEVLEITISRRRWQRYLATNGGVYVDRAARLEKIANDEGASRDANDRRPDAGERTAAAALRALVQVLDACRLHKLTRHPFVVLRLGELIALGEVAAEFSTRAPFASPASPVPIDVRCAMARIHARDALQRIADEGWSLVDGAVADGASLPARAPASLDANRHRAGLLSDMAVVARGVVDAFPLGAA